MPIIFFLFREEKEKKVVTSLDKFGGQPGPTSLRSSDLPDLTSRRSSHEDPTLPPHQSQHKICQKVEENSPDDLLKWRQFDMETGWCKDDIYRFYPHGFKVYQDFSYL